ncbi:hypothetical protein EYF80_048149 [Liparis tanakae]|uniref:Uncharacterized protein n=1 Tax=Liparis tanakae TaxID=230148 RepID=A0A4Z2FKA7_9TELE|nr:hypothetical protein EYF80_048149 [Liparis tanakae]
MNLESSSSSSSSQKASGGPIPIFSLLRVSQVLTRVSVHRRLTNSKAHAASASGTSGGIGHLGVMDRCGGCTGVTGSPPAVDGEHSPGVGCMLSRATQTPAGEHNCLREAAHPTA